MAKLFITREEFVNILARMDRVTTVSNKIGELLKGSENDILFDTRNAADIMLAEQGILIELLERIMEDKYKMIDAFILEQDFGRYEKYNKCVDPDGKEIDVSTAEKLYDYLVEEMN